MLVSHRKKFIFTKTHKTAGTSVEAYYETYCMPEGDWTLSHQRDEHISKAGIIGARKVKSKRDKDCKYFNHMSASQIKGLIGDEIWNDYFKFTVIRNPFSKMVSGWYHFQKPLMTKRHTLKALIKQPWKLYYLLSGKRDAIDFQEWVSNGDRIIDRDKYLIDGEVCVDFFIRQESLAAGIEQVNTILGIDDVKKEIPRFKTHHRPKTIAINQFYDAKTEAIVRSEYEWELDYFDYDMPLSV